MYNGVAMTTTNIRKTKYANTRECYLSSLTVRPHRNRLGFPGGGRRSMETGSLAVLGRCVRVGLGTALSKSEI